MAANPQITGFDASSVRVGLRLAMTVGTPVDEAGNADGPVFYMPITGASAPSITGAPVDPQGVPFDPSVRVARPVRTTVSNVPCAIEYQDSSGQMTNFGLTAPSRLILTFLDQDYEQVKGFEFCVLGGVKYDYRRTEAPKALVTVGLYRVHCAAEDVG